MAALSTAQLGARFNSDLGALHYSFHGQKQLPVQWGSDK